MELQQLKYFKTVAEMGKISEAAQAMFVSAPALSASISRLEKELGMPLFERTNNSIKLNHQGQIFLRYVNQVFANLDCAKVELRQSMMQQGQHVSVATMSSNQWYDLITAFSLEYPHFTLSFTSLRVSQFAGSGLQPQYTFLLGDDWGEVSPFSAGELDSIPLFQDTLTLMVPPEHPFAARDSIEMSELLGENLFLPVQDYPLYERLMRAFVSAGIPAHTANSYTSLVSRHMVKEGRGVSFSTLHTGGTYQDGLCHIPISIPKWTVRLYWRRNREFTEDEQQFYTFVKDFYGKDALLHKV